MTDDYKITVITVTTDNKGYFDALKEGCDKYGFDLKIIGYGEKWGGFVWRFKKIKEYLMNSSMDSKNITIVVDGYDTLCINSKDELLRRFLNMKTNILFSRDGLSESFLLQYGQDKVFKSCNGLRLSAGLYMGYTKSIWELTNLMCEMFDCNDPSLDDQRIITQLCRENNDFYRNNIKIDKNSEIFYNLLPNSIFTSDVNMDKHIVNGKFYGNKVSPIFLGGPGNVNMDTIAKLYKFNIKKIVKRHRLHHVKNVIKIYHRYIIPELCCLIIMIFVFFVIIGYLLRKNKVIN